MPNAHSARIGSSVLQFVVVLVAIMLLGSGVAVYFLSSADNDKAETDTIVSAPANELADKGGDAGLDAAADASDSADAGEVVSIEGDLDSVDWNLYRNRVVRIPGELVVIDTYDLARFGQFRVARERLYIPTSMVDPNDADPSKTSAQGGSNVAKVAAAQKRNDRGSITLDDGLSKQNVFPFTLLPEVGSKQKTLRVGSKLTKLSARVVDQDGKLYLVPIEPMKIEYAARPERPSLGDANVIVASFNVLNYFTTIDDGKNKARGADSPEEFSRQKSKIVAAIMGLDADVIGLMEMENNLEAENDLVAALNAAAGSEIYAGVGVPDQFKDAPGGSDAIRVGIIYRSDRVSPVGSVGLINDFAFVNARTPLVQSFRRAVGSDEFAVIVNHFKSKGGDAGGDDKDKGDGQGGFNRSRTRQATALTKYIDSRLANDSDANNSDANILIIGDLNAYQEEDPIDTLRAAGLVDLSEQSDANTSEPYSYVYYGQSGSLDHAFATSGLAKRVTGATTWHINADEPHWLDYNMEYKPESLFDASPFRSSDHDPVLIGFRLD